MNEKRPSPQSDLAWLFGESESQMGLHSSFDSFIIASKVGLNEARIDDSDALVNAAQEAAFNLDPEDAMIATIDRRGTSRRSASARHRLVMDAYRRIDVHHQRVLEAAYEARQLPLRVRGELMDAAGVARLTPTARRLADGFTYAWLGRSLSQEGPKGLAIAREAREMFEAAVAAYAAAREGAAA